MKFDLAKHFEITPQDSSLHDDPRCFCKKFKDGEEMWQSKPHSSPKPNSVHIVTIPAPLARDPSQSQQPWQPEEEFQGREMEPMFEEDQ